MFLEHHSRRKFYRYPQGAVATGEKIRMRISVSSFEIPNEVSLFVDDKKIPMYFVAEIANNRIYECYIDVPNEPCLLWYYFKVTADSQTKYFSNNDNLLGGLGKMTNEKPDKLYQITVYHKNFKTPDWMKNAIVYQIFPDRFFASKDTVCHGIKREWGDEPYYTAEQFGGEYLSNDFFGGNFYGIKEKIPYLKELGINTIYFNPVFKSSSNHRYDTSDYENIDDNLGGNKAFDEFIEEAKKEGISVILDGVFSHTGADSKYFNKYGNFDEKGAYQSKDSKYFGWYNFENFPDKYDCWWGFDTLPNVNEVNPDYLDYILRNKDSIVKRWIKKGVMGWRLDVADELPDEFIKELRKAVKEENKDTMIIGEVWEDASNKVSYGVQRAFLWGGELDSVMNYVFRDAVMDYLTNKTNAEVFLKKLLSMKENYPKEAFYSALNLISGHDIARALTVLSGAPDFRLLSREEQAKYSISESDKELAKKRLELAVLLQMTFPGTPSVYYGDEAGLFGYADPFNRRCFPWGNEDKNLTEIHKKFIALRKKYKSLMTGDFENLLYLNNTVCYMRDIVGGKDVFGKSKNDECIIIMINSDACEYSSFELELGRFGICEIEEVFTKEKITLNNHRAKIDLQPLGYKVFYCKRDDTWKKTKYSALI